MCGIVGAIGKINFDYKKSIQSISHRGPDSSGEFRAESVFLGHTRLSIQDLSENGNQPMFSKDGRYVIVFNGEVYNHLEIRESLINDFDFKSTGDTETVLYAYIKYGKDALNLFNGIFAFAIYDIQEKIIFIARDQFGVKPLYIYQDHNCLLFSSEIKSFLVHDIDLELCPSAMANYISFLWSPGTQTPFSKVNKLLPGHYVQFNIDNLNLANPFKYYQTAITGKYSKLSEENLIDQLEEKLINAVRRQMLSDVPVGFFLSGGLDSSLLVAIAKKIFPDKQFPCFTIDSDPTSVAEEGFANDIYYAKKVASLLQVDLHIVKADINIVKDFDKMIWHLDEPQADAAPLNVLNIASLAREKGIKVLIGGTGGDDLFSGYRRHQALNMEKYFRIFPDVLAKFIKFILKNTPSNISFFRRLKKLTQNVDLSPEKRMAGYFTWLPEERLIELFSEAWRNQLQTYSQTSFFELLSKDISAEKSLLNKMLYWELNSFLVDHNLNYTDKMGMAVGVEARVPFLDIELVQFAQTLPPELKMKGNETKYILKKVAERYLPGEIIYRPKTGFGAPVRKWITEDLDEMIHQRLSPERLESKGIFNSDKVWKLINDNKKGKIDASYSIWALLAIHSWMEQFIYNNKKNEGRKGVSKGFLE